MLSPLLIMLVLLFGAFAGFLAGLLGIGGGVILVPLFLWLFHLAGFSADHVVHIAFGTSLAIILPTAISSTLGHRKRGNVDWHMVAFLAFGGMVGAALGSTAAALIAGTTLKLFFGVMQIIVGLKLLFFRQPQVRSTATVSAAPGPLILVGFAGGLFSAFFGVGGGVIAVPLMLIALRLPIHLAVGNSSALIVVSSFFAVICYIWYGLSAQLAAPFTLGYVNLLVALLVTPLTICCARLGVRLASRTSQTRLIKAFSVLLMLVGGKIVLGL